MAERRPITFARVLKGFLLASRWLQAPLYVGLTILVACLGVKFYLKILQTVPDLFRMEDRRLILGVLSAVDLVLVVNLVIMVIIWGYSKFVSPIDVDEGEQRLGWVTRLAPGTLRVEIAASLVAISAVRLLEAFLDLDEVPDDKLLWFVVIHLTFSLSAVMLAWLDKLGTPTPGHPHD